MTCEHDCPVCSESIEFSLWGDDDEQRCKNCGSTVMLEITVTATEEHYDHERTEYP